MIAHKPVNVVHIASGDLWAGAESQLFTLAKTLHNLEDVNIRVILLNHGELERRLLEVGIPVDILDESQLNSLQIMWRTRKLLYLWQPDVVHTHRIKENILGGLAAKLAGKIPNLRTVHGAPEHKPGWSKPHKHILYLLDWLVGRFLQHSIIAVSDDLAELLGRKFPPEKITVIENGIDIEAIKPFALVQETKSVDDLNKTAKIGLVGRLVAVKRIDLFIKIAQYMKEHHPDWSLHFHIYGDGPLKTKLEALSSQLDLQDIVIFEGHNDKIYNEIASLNVLIITSDHEGLPMTLLEAMVLGTPVISHSVGGIPKVLRNGDNGFLIHTQNISEYSSVIMHTLNNTTQTTELTLRAQQHVRDFYSSYHNASQYIKQYHSLAIE